MENEEENERKANNVNKEKKIIAHYGPEDEQYGKKFGWLSPEQVIAFLESLPGRIFPQEVTHVNDLPIRCLVVEYGERLPYSEAPGYGAIIAVGTYATYTFRELRALAEGKTLPLVSEEERPYYHPDWECRECHSEKYHPPRHLLGGQQIWYDDGRYGVPLEFLCRTHQWSIHYRVSTGDEAEMMQKCARDCRNRCAGHCTVYWEKRERELLAGVYYLPRYIDTPAPLDN